MNTNENLTKENKQLQHTGKSFQVRTVRKVKGLVILTSHNSILNVLFKFVFKNVSIVPGTFDEIQRPASDVR